MFKNIRNRFVSLVAMVALLAMPLGLVGVAGAAAACTSSNMACVGSGLCSGASLSTTQTDNCTDANGTTGIDNIIHDVINIFSIIVGVVSVIMIILGGLRYITSGGDSNNVSGAKNTIIYAVVGLVIVALAQFIVQFVLNKVAQ